MTAAGYRVMFTIRREYFRAIVDGVKTLEVRRATPRWRTVLVSALSDSEPVAVFVCGREVHRRRIVGGQVWPSARHALGRDLSTRGRADVGEGAVVVFDLGEAVA